jgi:hypothetical protein
MGVESMVPRAQLLNCVPLARVPRLGDWLRYFDSEFYRTHGHLEGIPDLAALNRQDLVNHFVNRGWQEGRSYSQFLYCFVDPAFYRSAYPELALKTDAHAVTHWMYEGYFEGRIPNLITKKLLEADFHLFQFGKVGSKAIEHAIYAAGCTDLVPHVHFGADLLVNYPDCPFTYREVIRRAEKVSFITGVREPLERFVSGYFQSNFECSIRHGEDVAAEEIIQQIRKNADSAQLDDLLNWFDHDFFSDIDIYSKDFDRTRGHAVYQNGKSRLFLYRFDFLSELTSPLSDFTRLPLRISPVNRAADKNYGPLYSQVIGAIRFPKSVVERVSESQLVRHFYSEHEIERLVDRWSEA